MPKAGFAIQDMFQPSARGFVETVGSKKLGEVTGCVSRYVQWQPNKKTGAQLEPLTSVILSIAAIDAAGTRIAEPVEQELVAEWGPKDGTAIRVRPGLADSRDADAADTVDENGQLVLGTEGNCLFVDEGSKINMVNSFGVFVASCQEHGFKPQILNAGYLTDFVGTRAWFDLKPRKYNDKTGAEKTVEEFVAVEFVRYPYEASAKAAAPAKAKPGPKPAVAAPAPAAAAPKVNGIAAAPADANIEAVCIDLLSKVSAEIAPGPQASGSFARQKLIVLALQKALAPSSGIAKTQHKEIQ